MNFKCTSQQRLSSFLIHHQSLKMFDVAPSVGKVMLTVLWVMNSVTVIDFLHRQSIINSSSVLQTSEGNICLQYEHFSGCSYYNKVLFIEVLSYTPYLPQLALRDCCILKPVKPSLSKIHICADEKVQCVVQDSEIYHANHKISLMASWPV